MTLLGGKVIWKVKLASLIFPIVSQQQNNHLHQRKSRIQIVLRVKRKHPKAKLLEEAFLSETRRRKRSRSFKMRSKDYKNWDLVNNIGLISILHQQLRQNQRP